MLEPLDADDPARLGPYLLEGRLGPDVYLGHDDAGTAAAVRTVDALPAGRLAALGRVRSRHVAAVLGSDASAAPPWVATEYVAGPTLAAVVGEHGALPVPAVLELAAAVARGVAAIHAVGLGHGDLHAGKVVMAAGGARVIGFGVVGGGGEPDADVPALGRLIAFAATGGDGEADAVPEPLRELVRRCLAEDAAERPSPAEVAGDVARAQADPLAYQAVSPPANPLDLSTGIPADAVVGPLTAGTETEPAEDPLAYPAADPPENPLDLSTGIPNDAIVGPIPPDNPPDLSTGIPADAMVGPLTADTKATEDPLAYPAADPPDNPLDLSAGIPNDAIVGPIPPDLSTDFPADAVVGPLTAGTEPAEHPLAYPAADPPENPLDLCRHPRRLHSRTDPTRRRGRPTPTTHLPGGHTTRQPARPVRRHPRRQHRRPHPTRRRGGGRARRRAR